MSNDKQQVLERIRSALGGSHHPADDAEHAYLRASEATREEIIEQFIERAADYRSDVRRVQSGAERAAIQEALARREVRRLVVPTDLPTEWIPEGVEIVSDAGTPLSYAELDETDGVLTGCAVAVAQTGSLVLDGGEGQGRRALTLLPDYHLCVVRADQVVGLIPEAITRLAPAVRERRQPVTFISGPSATSDIELNRVEGVHGPRTLDILVVG